MNPIGIACIALSSGCGAGLVWLLYGSYAGRETEVAMATSGPVQEAATGPDAAATDVQGDEPDPLLSWLHELPAVRSEDAEVPA
jgi:hypothetical protein